jgi:anti-sigma factor RsiW
MSCENLRKTNAYFDRELPAAEREAFEKHCANCAECATELSRLERMSRFVVAARFTDARREPFAWRANLNRQRVERLAQMLTAVAAVVMIFCGVSVLRGKAKTNTSAAVPSWEKTAVTLQFEPGPAAETDDPIVQVLLREQQP